jgi:hypothetical protein
MRLIIETLHGHETIDRPLEQGDVLWQTNASLPNVLGPCFNLTPGVRLYLTPDEWQETIETLLANRPGRPR